MALRAAPLVLLAAGMPKGGVAVGVGANPIRKVTNMLENMQAKVSEQEKKEAKLFDEAMCYCQTTTTDLQAQIEQGKASIDAIAAGLESGQNALQELKAQLAEHVGSRKQAKEDIATATGLREQEASTFASFKATTEQNLAALKKAVAALERGMGGAFVQTGAASTLKKFAMEKAVMTDAARDELVAFLSGTSQDDEFSPSTGEITGILKQMGDQMEASLKEATETEAAAVKGFQGLVAAKTGEVDTLTTQIEGEMMRVGEQGVSGAGGANSLDDAKQQLEDNTELLKETQASCKAKRGEYEEVKKELAVEQVALAEVIKLLTSDDALEMFKKTLPGSSSFLQVSVSESAVRAKALSVLSEVSRRHLKARPEVALIALALQGKSAGFADVIHMIDTMVDTLKKEQADDDSKKSYCNDEFDKTEDKKKELELSISDSQTAIEEMNGSITKRVEEISALHDSIKHLDLDVGEATDQRAREAAEYKELTANNGVAKELLIMAKKKLAKVYASFVQSSSSEKKQNGSGVIAMIDDIIRDLDKETQTAEVTEKSAQKRFEKFTAAAKAKRAEDSRSLTDAEASKAQAEEALQAEMGAMQDTHEKLMQNSEYDMSLHKTCDWLLENYGIRAQARTAEVDAMKKAKAVLSGADVSLLQMQNSRRMYMRR